MRQLASAVHPCNFQEYQNCDTSLLTGLDAFAFGYQVETLMLKMFWQFLLCFC
jgi:hypothetical protein